jgi:hypothetical protein
MSVPGFLLQRLAAARRRGEPFDEAWSAAVSAAMQQKAGGGRENWRVALDETRHAWQAAYEGAPAERGVVAAAMLGTPA